MDKISENKVNVLSLTVNGRKYHFPDYDICVIFSVNSGGISHLLRCLNDHRRYIIYSQK